MSRFSGKFDIAEFIFGMGGYFDKDGNQVKFGQDGISCYYSDELRDFEAFKKLTNGVIHQHYKVEVSKLNQEFVKQHCKEFDFKEIIEQVPDKRSKTGFKEKKSYKYTYWGKEYTLKELNRKSVYIEIDIHFDTLLDLIPYYPYIVTASCGSYVCISNESFVDREFKDHLKYGHISILNYKKSLQEHYLDVCKKYFLYKLEERTKIISIDYLTKKIDCGNYYLCTGDSEIDYMHNIEFVWADNQAKAHWTSPKMVYKNIIELSKSDVESFLAEDIKNGTVKIKYVEKCEFPLEVK